jgi:hypothetical protein
MNHHNIIDIYLSDFSPPYQAMLLISLAVAR